MEVFITPLLAILTTSNIPLAAALLFCILLIIDRRHILLDAKERERSLVEYSKERERRLDKIVDDALQGNISTSEALFALRMVLREIKEKMVF